MQKSPFKISQNFCFIPMMMAAVKGETAHYFVPSQNTNSELWEKLFKGSPELNMESYQQEKYQLFSQMQICKQIFEIRSAFFKNYKN